MGEVRGEKLEARVQSSGTGLVLRVPVGIDLKLFEMRLKGLEEDLERRKKQGVIGGGTWQNADFWLVALRGAELRAEGGAKSEARG